MDTIEKDSSLENLTKILSFLQNLYYKKQEQLEEIQLELSELKENLNFLNSIVSGKSFHSAEELFHDKSLNQIPKENSKLKNYFQEGVPLELVEGTEIKRKIFSKDGEELLCVLKFINLNKIEIKITEPEKRNLRETSEKFISIFIRDALIPVKDKNPEMTLTYEYFKNSKIIEKIIISNIKNINNYDLITSKMRALLVNEPTM